jgi:hypothetical protein
VQGAQVSDYLAPSSSITVATEISTGQVSLHLAVRISSQMSSLQDVQVSHVSAQERQLSLQATHSP